MLIRDWEITRQAGVWRSPLRWTGFDCGTGPGLVSRGPIRGSFPGSCPVPAIVPGEGLGVDPALTVSPKLLNAIHLQRSSTPGIQH